MGREWQGLCMAGGMHGGGVHGREACMAGGHVWQGGACVHGGGACMAGGPLADTTRYGQ